MEKNSQRESKGSISDALQTAPLHFYIIHGLSELYRMFCSVLFFGSGCNKQEQHTK